MTQNKYRKESDEEEKKKNSVLNSQYTSDLLPVNMIPMESEITTSTTNVFWRSHIFDFGFNERGFVWICENYNLNEYMPPVASKCLLSALSGDLISAKPSNLMGLEFECVFFWLKSHFIL